MRGKTLIRDHGDSIILVILLILGTLLRMYRLQDIPFTHDEFSALFRTRFDSFAELISKGVRIDTHPAGIQVYLYYWVKIFGEGEAAVKLPFILSGILSIYMVYRLGREWFGPMPGLIAAAFITSMEYTIMYSQVARPYSSGMLFVLIMVYAWSRYLFRPGKHPFLHLGVFILTGALSAYNHHFSMLFAFMVGISGLLFLERRTRIAYPLALVLIVILYLPHLSILLQQLGMGGIEGWLGKPDNDFIITYLGYIFHYSWPVYLVPAGILILGVVNWSSMPDRNKKFIFLSLAWFLVPFLAGFFYSRYVNAVLQYSVLIFSFPWLLYLVTGMMPELKGWRRPALISLVSIAMLLSLLVERQYYDLFYRNRFRELVIETDRTLREYGQDNCLVVMDSHKKISDHYYSKLDIKFDHIHYNDLGDNRDFIDLLRSSDREILSLACASESDLTLPNIVRDKFPRMLKKIDYYGGNYYVFSKDTTTADEFYFRFHNGFDSQARYWSEGIGSSYVDTLGYHDSTSYLMHSPQEFGPAFSRKLRSILIHRNDLVDVSLAVKDLDPRNRALLVVVLQDGKKQLNWTASHFDWYKPDREGWYRVYHTLRPAVTRNLRGIDINVYVWNKDGQSFLIDDFRIESRPGNHVLFGLLEKI